MINFKKISILLIMFSLSFGKVSSAGLIEGEQRHSKTTSKRFTQKSKEHKAGVTRRHRFNQKQRNKNLQTNQLSRSLNPILERQKYNRRVSFKKGVEKKRIRTQRRQSFRDSFRQKRLARPSLANQRLPIASVSQLADTDAQITKTGVQIANTDAPIANTAQPHHQPLILPTAVESQENHSIAPQKPTEEKLQIQKEVQYKLEDDQTRLAKLKEAEELKNKEEARIRLEKVKEEEELKNKEDERIHLEKEKEETERKNKEVEDLQLKLKDEQERKEKEARLEEEKKELERKNKEVEEQTRLKKIEEEQELKNKEDERVRLEKEKEELERKNKEEKEQTRLEEEKKVQELKNREDERVRLEKEKEELERKNKEAKEQIRLEEVKEEQAPKIMQAEQIPLEEAKEEQAPKVMQAEQISLEEVKEEQAPKVIQAEQISLEKPKEEQERIRLEKEQEEKEKQRLETVKVMPLLEEATKKCKKLDQYLKKYLNLPFKKVEGHPVGSKKQRNKAAISAMKNLQERTEGEKDEVLNSHSSKMAGNMQLYTFNQTNLYENTEKYFKWLNEGIVEVPECLKSHTTQDVENTFKEWLERTNPKLEDLEKKLIATLGNPDLVKDLQKGYFKNFIEGFAKDLELEPNLIGPQQEVLKSISEKLSNFEEIKKLYIGEVEKNIKTSDCIILYKNTGKTEEKKKKVAYIFSLSGKEKYNCIRIFTPKNKLLRLFSK